MKKIFEKIEVAVLAAVILAFAVLIPIIPDREFSDKENRALETAPKITADSLVQGEFSVQFAEYIADQFPFRDEFVAIKAQSELLLAKKENAGVLKAKNGVLIAAPNEDTSRLYDNLSCIEALKKKTAAKIITVPLPRTADVYSELLPRLYPKEKIDKVWQEFKSLAAKKELCTVSVYEKLCKNNLYYKTDHHYTTDGAYSVYGQLGGALGYTPKGQDFFKREVVSRDFCGTAMRRSGFYSVGKDKIALYRYDGDENYTVTADGKNSSLYDFEKLKETDKYAVFLGGNHSMVRINGKGESREKLLVIRDSFADSLAPFLAVHFDLVYIDLRYFSESISKLVNEEKIEKVLVLSSIEEIAASKNLSKLLMD